MPNRSILVALHSDLPPDLFILEESFLKMKIFWNIFSQLLC